ncbi:choice-of-anchor J domain-containing protein [Roseateles sp.]|uniref:choice-of-anchor J domain-containing protein n=1 Tax=Roseateles sp. TaxID=1971397 RepID=UPI003BAB03F8
MKSVKLAAGLLAAGLTLGAQADPYFTENFDSIAGLSATGWVLNNQSSPAGSAWFQGNSGVFGAQAGAADAYIAANFLSTTAVNGVVDNWLISPELAIGSGSTLTFYTQASDAGYLDKLEIRFSSGASTDLSSFSTVIGTVGSTSAYPVGSWLAVTVALPTAATGRFAFHYTVADANDASYIGIDSVSVSAVPEASTFAMLGLGLIAVGAIQRRRAAATATLSI